MSFRAVHPVMFDLELLLPICCICEFNAKGNPCLKHWPSWCRQRSTSANKIRSCYSLAFHSCINLPLVYSQSLGTLPPPPPHPPRQGKECWQFVILSDLVPAQQTLWNVGMQLNVWLLRLNGDLGSLFIFIFIILIRAEVKRNFSGWLNH